MVILCHPIQSHISIYGSSPIKQINIEIKKLKILLDSGNSLFITCSRHRNHQNIRILQKKKFKILFTFCFGENKLEKRSDERVISCANNLNMFLFEIFDSSSLWGNSVVTVVGVGVLYDLQA